MPKLEVFFDYECPYCLRGHQYLLELLPEFPDIEVVWCPCEAHPRPESYGLHSDLCIQGMYFAKEQGADVMDYHERMYRAALLDHVNIERIDELVKCALGLLDPEAFRAALEQGTYKKVQMKGNDYAYQQNGVWAVPSYRMGDRKLDAALGVGVSKEQLRAFLAGE